MKKYLKFDGERVVPNNTTPNHLLKEHIDRYIFAKKYVNGKVVLDIACGTGYGSLELAKAGAKRLLEEIYLKKHWNMPLRIIKKKTYRLKK